jgi:hypothetical protein
MHIVVGQLETFTQRKVRFAHHLGWIQTSQSELIALV